MITTVDTPAGEAVGVSDVSFEDSNLTIQPWHGVGDQGMIISAVESGTQSVVVISFADWERLKELL